MELANVPAGLIVTTLLLILTFAFPTGIDSNPPSLLDPIEINMLPLPATTVSLNVNTILSFTPTPVAPSAGEELERVGSTPSTTKALLTPNELLAPGLARVKIALLPAASFIEPLFKAKEVVAL